MRQMLESDMETEGREAGKGGVGKKKERESGKY